MLRTRHAYRHIYKLRISRCSSLFCGFKSAKTQIEPNRSGKKPNRSRIGSGVTKTDPEPDQTESFRGVRKQNKWIQFLIDFHFVIIYLSKKSNEKADSLIKRTKDVSDKKNDRQKQQNQILLFSKRFKQLSFLQTVELIIMFESNRLLFMQKMHD
jgi:hypothetical protein